MAAEVERMKGEGTIIYPIDKGLSSAFRGNQVPHRVIHRPDGLNEAYIFLLLFLKQQ